MKTKTILLLEDCMMLAHAVSNALRMKGYNIYHATDIATAINIIETNQDYQAKKPDLIFMDWYMESGLNTGAFIGYLRDNQINIPLIITSGADPADLPPDAIFLPKPYSMKSIMDSIQKNLESPHE